VSGSLLFLIYANDIDDSGRIVGLAYDPSIGDYPAFVAVPSGTSMSVSQTVSPPTPALAQNVRDMLQRRPGLAPIR